MTKITLNDLSTISGNEQSAINLINANNATIETASDNTLSRDGTSPNQMLSNLDMNSFRISNCVDAVNAQEPATYSQVLSLVATAFPSTVPLGPGVAAWLASPTSANLATAVTNETGSGLLVFGTSPTLTTPTLTSAVITTTSLKPTTDDGAALGDTTHEFSDLFLAFGGVINFSAGDITLTHSSNILSFSGASNGYRFDSALFPASDDGAPLGSGTLEWSDLFLASGGVINWFNGGVTIGHFVDGLTFAGGISGYYFQDGPIGPAVNDGSALGTTANKWSDLFLADGGVINWNSGNVTLTHSAGSIFTNANWSQTGVMRIVSSTAIPAGGTATIGYQFSSTTNFGIFFGSGAPTLSAAQGSIYLRSDGGANTRIYSNNNGTTGWSAMTG